MKVIDLLNKIAKNELPNKTKFKVFSSSDDERNPFICEYDDSYPGTIWSGDGECKWNFKIDNMRILNYEVEVIEEPKEELEEIELLDTPYTKSENDFAVEKKINELIANQNKIIIKLKANSKQ